MYLHAKNEVSMSSGTKVIVWTDVHTDRQTHTHTHTERHDRKHYLPAYAGGNKLIIYLNQMDQLENEHIHWNVALILNHLVNNSCLTCFGGFFTVVNIHFSFQHLLELHIVSTVKILLLRLPNDNIIHFSNSVISYYLNSENCPCKKAHINSGDIDSRFLRLNMNNV